MSDQKLAFITGAEHDLEFVERELDGLSYQLTVGVCRSQEEVVRFARGSDIVVTYGVPIPAEVIGKLETTRAIVTGSHGFDDIDVGAATDKGIMVVNNSGVIAEEVSTHAITLLLASARKLTVQNDLVKAGRWDREIYSGLLPLPSICGQTLGLAGLGTIGSATAVKAKAFSLEVIAYDPYAPPGTAERYGAELVDTLEEVARRSDFVSIHTPLNDGTRRMFGRSFFKAMKPTAYFINTARGKTVDEQALVPALQNGEIAGAGLDVFEQEPIPGDSPLLKMDNVIVTPHSAGFSDASGRRVDASLGQEVARILRGESPRSVVNPQVLAADAT